MIESASIKLTITTKTDYEFSGWSGTSVDVEMSRDVIIYSSSIGNREYIAHCTANTYVISYDLNGGTLLNGNPASYTIYTETFTLNNLLDNCLVGVQTQNDLCGKDGVITQLNKAILERILNAEMDFHLDDIQSGRVAENSRNRHGKQKVSGNFGEIEREIPQYM